MNIDGFLKHFAQNYGFQNVQLKIESGSQVGDNFVGILYKVVISGEISGRPSTLHVIVKTAPINADIRDSMPIREFFFREMFAYNEALPILNNLQTKLPEINKFRFAKCYTVHRENLNELLVLEDLMLESYQLHRPRHQTLDLEHLSVALTTLAKLHALSFVLMKENPNAFKMLAAEANDNMFSSPDSFMRTHCEKAGDSAIKAIEDKILLEKLEPFAKKTFEIIGKLLKPQKYSVLCHGDYWKNNVLFTYQNGKPVSACPVDYQLLRYASVVTDVNYILFLCTSQALRRQHYHALLQVYYDALRTQLEKFSLDIENVFPKDEFVAEVKTFGPIGLAASICDLMFMTCATEDMVNGEVQTGREDSNSYKLYKERMKEIVEDSIEYGFL